VARILRILFITYIAMFFIACTNIGGASKSSTSLSNFLGFSELPRWYITSRYTYPDSRYRRNDFKLPIHYRDVGEGDTIVLLHGEMSSLHTWEAWIEVLKQDFRVIAIDLPGSGLTGSPRCINDPQSLCPENLSEDYILHSLKYLIEDLQLDSFHLVGASYGGYLASKYSLEHSDKINSLTLIAPLGFQQERPFMVSYFDNTSFYSQYFQPSTVVTTVVDELYAKPENVTQNTLQRYIHLSQAPGAHETNVIQMTMVGDLMEHGTEDRFDEIQARTLIMWGNQDKWGQFDHAQRWVDELPNATLVEYRNVGHVSMEEHADDSAYDLVAFVNEEPLPTIEGLGRDSFSLKDAVDALDQEALFGPSDGSGPAEQSLEEVEDDTTTMVDE
jgi:pimeloyl-ACP methyl ester carboxylesterase